MFRFAYKASLWHWVRRQSLRYSLSVLFFFFFVFFFFPSTSKSCYSYFYYCYYCHCHHYYFYWYHHDHHCIIIVIIIIKSWDISCQADRFHVPKLRLFKCLQFFLSYKSFLCNRCTASFSSFIAVIIFINTITIVLLSTSSSSLNPEAAVVKPTDFMFLNLGCLNVCSSFFLTGVFSATGALLPPAGRSVQPWCAVIRTAHDEGERTECQTGMPRCTVPAWLLQPHFQRVFVERVPEGDYVVTKVFMPG